MWALRRLCAVLTSDCQLSLTRKHGDLSSEPLTPACKGASRGCGPHQSRDMFQRRLVEILDHGAVGDRIGRLVGRSIVLLIIINIFLP